MAIRTSKDKLGLRRATHAAETLVTSALDVLLKTWADRLLPSIRAERTILDNWAEELEKGQPDAYPDDILTDDYVVIEETQQILRALLTTGVYHVFEQHMIRFFYRWAKYYRCQKPTLHPSRPPAKGPSPCGCDISRAPQLKDVIDAFNAAWSMSLDTLRSYPQVDELRLVANCVKHGEGKACDQLKAIRSDWFKPDEEVIPLSAYGLQIPEDYLQQAIEAVKSFLSELKDTLDKAPTET